MTIKAIGAPHRDDPNAFFLEAIIFCPTANNTSSSTEWLQGREHAMGQDAHGAQGRRQRHDVRAVTLDDGSTGSLYVGVILADGSKLGQTSGKGAGSSN